jgi:hypothetical protein
MNWKHGFYSIPEYHVWVKMKERCLNPRNKAYKNWGGRGIGVCKQWAESFPQFLKDMGSRPSPVHKLERRNNNLGYSLENCVWATQKEQSRNTRKNRLLDYRGVVASVAEWAERTGIPCQTIHTRLRLGWTVEEILTPLTPEQSRRRTALKVRGVPKSPEHKAKIATALQGNRNACK